MHVRLLPSVRSGFGPRMALLNYLHKKRSEDQGIFLPKADSGVLPSEVVASANAHVGEMASEVELKPKRRKTMQNTYSAERRGSIRKYADQQLL